MKILQIEMSVLNRVSQKIETVNVKETFKKKKKKKTDRKRNRLIMELKFFFFLCIFIPGVIMCQIYRKRSRPFE